MLLPLAATLRKEERLHLEKDISRLLGSGKWGSDGCIRFCAAPSGEDFARMMVAVPKRLFKRAVKRNLLKRRIREAYRLQKPDVPIDILLQYISKEVLPFAQIKESVAAAIEKAEKAYAVAVAKAAQAKASEGVVEDGFVGDEAGKEAVGDGAGEKAAK